MAMRYLAGKLRAPAPAAATLRRPRSLSANASQGGRSNATTDQVTSSMNVARNKDGELGWVQEEVAKLEELSRDIEEAIRYNRFHRRCIMAPIVGPIWGSLSRLQLFPKAVSTRSCPKQSTASKNL